MALKTFIINQAGKANLKTDLIGMPREPKIKPNASPSALKHMTRLLEKYRKDIRLFERGLKSYDVIGYKQDAGIPSLASIIGKEVEAESAQQGIYIHYLTPKANE